MKKQLLTLALVMLAAAASYAQGTIQLQNSVGTPIGIDANNDGVKDRNAAATDGVVVSVWFGAAGASSDADLARFGTTAQVGAGGVISGGLNVFGLGTGTDGGQTVSLQIRAVTADGALSGRTKVAQVVLGPTAGPGTVIWQGNTGTDVNRFKPLLLTVPEPSTIALGVLGLGSLLLFRRRK